MTGNRQTIDANLVATVRELLARTPAKLRLECGHQIERFLQFACYTTPNAEKYASTPAMSSSGQLPIISHRPARYSTVRLQLSLPSSLLPNRTVSR